MGEMMTIASNLNNPCTATAQFSNISKIKSDLCQFAFDGINFNKNFMIPEFRAFQQVFCMLLMSLVKHCPSTAIY